MTVIDAERHGLVLFSTRTGTAQGLFGPLILPDNRRLETVLCTGAVKVG